MRLISTVSLVKTSIGAALRVNDKQSRAAGFAMSKYAYSRTLHGWQKAARFGGLVIAASVALWFMLGLLGLVPSIVQVFGSAGVKTPAAVIVAGLLIAALGFWED